MAGKQDRLPMIERFACRWPTLANALPGIVESPTLLTNRGISGPVCSRSGDASAFEDWVDELGVAVADYVVLLGAEVCAGVMTGDPPKGSSRGRQADGSFGLWPMVRRS
jgi:hypothetical protein